VDESDAMDDLLIEMDGCAEGRRRGWRVAGGKERRERGEREGRERGSENERQGLVS
jgi:hypothetical protein